MVQAKPKLEEDGVLDGLRIRLPIEADVLIAYATAPGYLSFRRGYDEDGKVVGSWFVFELCAALGQWGFQLDLVQILTRVCLAVSVNYQSDTGKEATHASKQCPTFVSRLTKQLKFPKPN